MNRVLPRMSREEALPFVQDARIADIAELGTILPHREVEMTWPPVGGSRISDADLTEIRAEILNLARANGLPAQVPTTASFDSAAASRLHQLLRLSPHEASNAEAWTYLTCSWLLDIATWRFNRSNDDNRFLGHVNRNTFRRLWWRQEILGDLQGRLTEDELVNIMERPTLTAHPPLARTVVTWFLDTIERQPNLQRSMLMRETAKRLLRRTPYLDFRALSQTELDLQVYEALGASVRAMTGSGLALPAPPATARRAAPHASEHVRRITEITRTDPNDDQDVQSVGYDQTSLIPSLTLDQAGLAAIQIATRSGRVTNQDLRQLLSIEPSTARQILLDLVEQGVLARRGQARGTYYVIIARGTDDNKIAAATPVAGTVKADADPPNDAPDGFDPPSEAPPVRSAFMLRRILRRRD